MTTKQAVLLLCGVPGSGKTWVMRQLAHKFALVHNDDYIGYGHEHKASVVSLVADMDKPVLVDCPFGERPFRDCLESHGLEVYPFFIVEEPWVIQERYEAREGKPVSKATLTRAETILERAAEWNVPRGTSEEILAHLRELVITPATGS